jgi:hypothetical protein
LVVVCFVAAEWMSGIEKQRSATKGEETETPQDQAQSTRGEQRTSWMGARRRGVADAALCCTVLRR